jgi:hypothetical protein
MNPYDQITNNPFLCKDCQQLGYCRKSREAGKVHIKLMQYTIASSLNPKYSYMKDTDITNLVPIKTMVKDYMTTAGKKLQEAHDLFHQNEYEQASYLYRDLLLQRGDYDEATIGLAASYYFMKQYEEASSIAISINTHAYNKFIQQFLDACSRQVEEDKYIEHINANKFKISFL